MPYKHPADKIETILHWQNEKDDTFGGDFNPKHPRWLMCFTKVLDITPSDLETVKLQYKDCKLKVEEHFKRFNREVGDWIECDLFLRVSIYTEAYIPSKIQGQKIAPCKENSELLEMLFWKALEMMKQVEAMSPGEVKKARLAHGLKP